MRIQGFLVIQNCDIFYFKAINDVACMYINTLFSLAARFKVPVPVLIADWVATILGWFHTDTWDMLASWYARIHQFFYVFPFVLIFFIVV